MNFINKITVGFRFGLAGCFIALLLSAMPFGFDIAVYYKVMEDGNVMKIDQQIKIIAADTEINKDAYTGALLMKKAGLVKGLSKRLDLFKEGHKRLEVAIQTERYNPEFRFLRLIIQEHAPKILGYRSEIDEDAKILHDNFLKFSDEVKAAIINYRKQSPALQKLTF